jgi:predicted DNA-binding mobile mystery protein A
MTRSRPHAVRLDDWLRGPCARGLPRPPREGWVKALRNERGISSRALASRLGVSQPAVIQAEQHEAAGTISLLTLFRMAEALDCDLRYVLVPKARRRG